MDIPPHHCKRLQDWVLFGHMNMSAVILKKNMIYFTFKQPNHNLLKKSPDYEFKLDPYLEVNCAKCKILKIETHAVFMMFFRSKATFKTEMSVHLSIRVDIGETFLFIFMTDG